MTEPITPDIEAQLAEWRGFVAKRRAVGAPDLDELESHLRDQIDDLTASGLAPDEAFIVAVKRMGSVDALSHEFALEHSDRLWKQLVLGDADESADARRRNSTMIAALVLAVGAAIAVKIPSLFGSGIPDDPEFLLRNAFVFVLPFLGAYFCWVKRPPIAVTAVAVGGFAAIAAALNIYPLAPSADTLWLAVAHSGVALWLLVGLVYTGSDWRSERGRMDFIRFTGEWFVYFVLIALGGAVLSGLTIAVFSAIDLDAARFVSDWLIPCGAAGAVIIAAWLVEAKQSVIENIAPVLTKVFTPLFTALLLVLVVAAATQGDLLGGESGETVAFGSSRELLIIFDIVLIVVLALLLYSMSAREPLRRPGWFDRLQLVMIGSAIIVDAILLAAMIARIGAFGFSANKVASLGLNLILLVNLMWAAWLLVRFLRRRTPFATLERWQTSYLPVYFAWAVVVVVVFPPLFDFA